MFRIDAPIYFANIQWIKERLEGFASAHRVWSQEHGERGRGDLLCVGAADVVATLDWLVVQAASKARTM